MGCREHPDRRINAARINAKLPTRPEKYFKADFMSSSPRNCSETSSAVNLVASATVLAAEFADKIPAPQILSSRGVNCVPASLELPGPAPSTNPTPNRPRSPGLCGEGPPDTPPRSTRPPDVPHSDPSRYS